MKMAGTSYDSLREVGDDATFRDNRREGAGHERLSLLSWLPAPLCSPTGGRIVVVVMVIVGTIGGRGLSHWGKWIAGGLGTQLCYLERFYKHKKVNLATCAHNTHLAVVKTHRYIKLDRVQ